eukprot:m.62314 g.62314  ORF g.62314 m.62314 type:complete len:100 (+) comp35054_c0_seq7:63-362(+)
MASPAKPTSEITSRWQQRIRELEEAISYSPVKGDLKKITDAVMLAAKTPPKAQDLKLSDSSKHLRVMIDLLEGPIAVAIQLNSIAIPSHCRRSHMLSIS